MSELKKHTDQQRKALHLYFDILAEALNNAGLDMRKTLKPGVDIPWTRENVKNHLWRPIQIAMTEKKSTTALDRVEPSLIYEVLNKHLAEKFGVSVPFPSEETDPKNQAA